MAGRPFLCIVSLLILFSPPSQSTAFFGARLEPPDGKIYHGAQAEVRPMGFFSRKVDWNGIEAYSEACGYRPRLLMHYISLDPLAFRVLQPTIYEIARKSHAYIPQIGLDFYTYAPFFDILNPCDITEKIARGSYDKRIKKLARLFKKMGCPVFLRPGYEFGGNGQGQHASKEYWIDAWKNIFTIFKNEGADNVAFVWNTLDAGDYLDYYPGDEFVDWWAINIFENFADRNEFVNAFIQDAANHHKPVMIAESTPRYVGAGQAVNSWQQWYEPYFNLISQYPHIKAFCYINASWHNYPDRSFAYDCRIQINQYVKNAYSRMLSDPKFIHTEAVR